MNDRPIRPKERDAVLQSLKAGVVPRLGIQHIQVGRAKEVEALLSDIERLADGGSCIRFIIGEYGSGKTFFLHLVRTLAQEKNLLTMHADLTPDRRLHATGGQARSLYAELMRNLASRSKPEGGASTNVVEKFVSSALIESREMGSKVTTVIEGRLKSLSEMVGGYDFAEVVAAYWNGHESGNEQLKADAVRWLRAEFSTKTDARAALGVRTIVDDSNVYDHLKLFALFARLAGYGGLLVGLDELVNLYKLANVQARTANYEQLLRILNDSLQGLSTGLGFLLCGTPDFLMDPRRGLYSYPALQSRLAENAFAKQQGISDFSGPVLRLSSLSREELFVLLTKIRYVFSGGDPGTLLVPDEALSAFMEHCSKRIGEAYFRTPRTTIRSFVDFLSTLEQAKDLTWETLLDHVKVQKDQENEPFLPETSPPEGNSVEAREEQGKDDDELTSFKL